MKIDDLQHYPRFVFSCSDGRCYSTAELKGLKYIKREHIDSPIDAFYTGEIITIIWDTDPTPVRYKVDKIDVRDIRYHTDEKLYGIHGDDCSVIQGKEKFHLMSIFVFLERIK